MFAGTVTADDDMIPGTVGAVIACNEIRLKDLSLRVVLGRS